MAAEVLAQLGHVAAVHPRLLHSKSIAELWVHMLAETMYAL